MLQPMLMGCLRGYTRQQFLADVLAGVVVGIVALPLAMAFAIASGVSPERGLYTAVIAGVVVAVLGGTRVQIAGPSGAAVVIIYDIVLHYGLEGLLACTFLAGVMLVILGLARFGRAIKYVPYPVVAGFTAGSAIIIASAQVKDLLGLQTGPLPSDVLGKWSSCCQHLGSFNLPAALLAVGCITLIVWWPQRWQRVPGSVVALVLATVAVQLFGLSVPTIGNSYGAFPAGLPELHVPNLDLNHIRDLIRPAVAIALLAAMEALLSAVAADGMTGHKHRSNMELVAVGVANMLTPLVGGLPGTGGMARTAANIRNGASTPIAALVHALVVALLVVAFGTWASLIPMSSLAAVLVVVAYRMGDWRAFTRLLRAPRTDVVVFLTTFTITVVFNLVLAVEVGVALAALLFLRRVTRLATRRRWPPQQMELATQTVRVRDREIPPGVMVYEVAGPFLFGAALKFHEVIGMVAEEPQIIILRLRQIFVVDEEGCRYLELFVQQCRRTQTKIILSSVQPEVREKLLARPFWQSLDRRNLAPDLDIALLRARDLLGLPLWAEQEQPAQRQAA
jgi:SulP family sulfate permease